MAKIISAQSILKQKGYVQNKFDTNGFMQAVGQYFIDNSVESKLLLVPFRFLDIDRTLQDDGKERYNPFGITEEEVKVGYKVQTKMKKLECFDYPEWAYDLSKSDWENFQKQEQAGLDEPRIVVDKPFFENAAATLRLMGGYVVEKQMKKRRKLYWVTLV